MMGPMETPLRAALEEHGLLLESDARLPSIAALVAGAPIKGSWWSHPKGRAIFAACGLLADDPDALITKLVGGKVTYVHRRLWAPLLSVARAQEAWQTRGLTPKARALLKLVAAEGSIRADRAGAKGRDAAELERRLLVHSESEHTESGAHQRVLETWEHWARRAKFRAAAMDPGRGRALLEEALAAMNARSGALASLPWDEERRGAPRPRRRS